MQILKAILLFTTTACPLVSFIFCFHVLCPKQQAAEDDVVLSTTGATCASVIITACFMESAVKTLKLNAPQVRLFFPDISPVLPVNVTLC